MDLQITSAGSMSRLHCETAGARACMLAGVTYKRAGHHPGEGVVVIGGQVEAVEQEVVRSLQVEALLHFGEWRQDDVQVDDSDENERKSCKELKWVRTMALIWSTFFLVRTSRIDVQYHLVGTIVAGTCWRCVPAHVPYPLGVNIANIRGDLRDLSSSSPFAITQLNYIMCLNMFERPTQLYLCCTPR